MTYQLADDTTLVISSPNKNVYELNLIMTIQADSVVCFQANDLSE